MSAITIPQAGEIYVGDRPALPKIAKCIAGFTATGNDVDLIAQTCYNLFSIAADTMVLKVRSIILTAFTASVTLDIGDDTDNDGWLATAKIGPTSAVTSGIYKDSTLPTAEAYAGGKLYSAADTIDVWVAGATPVAGVMHVLMTYIENYTSL